jgi:hypothetical protein
VYYDPRMLCGPFRHSDPPNTLVSLSIGCIPKQWRAGFQSCIVYSLYERVSTVLRSHQKIPPGTRGSAIGAQYDSNITAQNVPVFQALQSS